MIIRITLSNYRLSKKARILISTHHTVIFLDSGFLYVFSPFPSPSLNSGIYVVVVAIQDGRDNTYGT